MLKIKDYLVLVTIYRYLESEREEELQESNGYSNSLIQNIEDMLKDLKKIIVKLESEE